MRLDLERLRRQARELQRKTRASGSDMKLSAAQLAVAREYGFASWTRLKRAVEAAKELGFDSALASTTGKDAAEEFCRLACLTYARDDGPERWAQARRLLAERPQLTAANIWAAAAANRPDDVRQLLAERSDRARERGGPFNWRPLCYLVYSRVDPDVALDVVLDTARELLANGADPNEGFLWDGHLPPFTLLTGAFGAGELGSHRQPQHPHGLALARLLLDAGADPNDGQTLYNRMFSANDEHLELLFEYGLGRGDGGPWKARGGDRLDSPAEMLRTLLRWAVEHDQRDRVRLLVEHGVDFHSPYTGGGPAWRAGNGRTPVELARLNGNAEIAEYLIGQGATPPAADPVSELIAAALRADVPMVTRLVRDHPDAVEEARQTRPGLIVWAAAQASAAAVEMVAGLGFDVNALGRADAPVEEPWETALHHSAGEGDVDLTRRLLALGADPTIRDKRFDATPLDWARHFDQAATVELLTDP